MLLVGVTLALGRRRQQRQRLRVASAPLAESQYAAVRKPRKHWASKPSLLPLGYWPMARARFAERPKIRARSLALFLLSVPLDAAAAAAVAGAVVWLTTMHLVYLAGATVRVAFSASWWLKPTPVGTARFAISVGCRAFVGQLASCALLVGIAVGIAGAQAARGLIHGVMVWVAAVCVLYVAASTLAIRGRSVASSTLHRWMACK